MSIPIYGLTCSRDMRQGRYWIIRRETMPLNADELSKLDIRMLERTSIPHVLPVDVEEVNSEVLLRYRLPLGLALEEFIRSGEGGIKTVLQLLHSLVLILEDSRQYMLDESKYILLASFILVGRDTEDVYAAYLPLRCIEQKRSVRQELYQLTLQMLDWARVPYEACPILLDCLKSSLFELLEFKQLLIGLQADSGVVRRQTMSEPKPDQREPRISEELDLRDSRIPEPRREKSEAGFSIREDDSLLHDGDTLHFQPAKLSLRNSAAFRVLMVLLILIWAGVAWKPSEGSMLLGAGLTLLFGLLYSLWSKSRRKETACGDDEDPFSDPWDVEFPASVLTEQPAPSPRIERAFDWSEDKQKLYAATPAQTVFLMKPDETVLLAPETVLLFPKAYLDYEGAGGKISVELHKEKFIYGRSPEEADWVLNETGVSRIHGEILRRNREWSMRDLGSKNGSKLNGEALQPDREYPLKDGDRIAAAQAEFVFRVS